jgi:TolB-like protein
MARISFGQFVFDPDTGLTDADRKAVTLNQRGHAILEALLSAQGKVVSKAELMERVWPGLIVEEGNLTVQIASLRKALGDAPGGREWIVTVPRIGYRMIIPDAIQPAAKVANVPTPAPDLPMLAVMPFQNLSGDPAQDYFADGIVEDIITALSRFKSFAVIARNSTFAYKGRAIDVREIAKDLNVSYVLEGSVRHAGNKLRITTQLIDGKTGENLWAQSFDGVADDVFEFQDQITAGVAAIVEPQIQSAEIEHSRRERPGSFAVYDLYLRALAKRNASSPAGFAAAYALLNEALQLEPDNALLLANAASALDHRLSVDAPPIGPNDRLTCVDLARRGLARPTRDAMVMAHCGMALLLVGKEYELGLASIQRALQTNPNSLFVLVCAGVANLLCGSVEESLIHMHRALKLSPRDPQQRYALTGIAHVHMIRRNFDEAIIWAERSLAIDMQNPPTYWILASANAQLGQMAEAKRYLDALQTVTPGATIAGIKAAQPDKNPDRLAAILEGLHLAGMQ